MRQINRQPINILLIEEDRAFAGLVSRAFKSSPGKFTLTTIANLAEAREYLTQNSPDLAIADIILSDGSGIELVAISQEHGGFPVVLITGYGDAQEAVAAIKAGAIDCIVKSKETLDSFPQIVERTLRQWQHIIERKRAEEGLRKSEEFAKAVLNATTDMVYLVDLADNILTVNEIAAKNFGKSPDELIGKNIFDFFPPQIAKSRKKQGDKVAHSGQSLSFQDERGERVYDTFIYPTFDQGGEVDRLAVFVRDITERKKAEEDAHRIQLELAVITERLKLLKEREREVMHMIAEGKLNKEIAFKLGLSRRTIETYRARIMKKLQVDSVAELVRYLTKIESQR